MFFSSSFFFFFFFFGGGGTGLCRQYVFYLNWSHVRVYMSCITKERIKERIIYIIYKERITIELTHYVRHSFTASRLSRRFFFSGPATIQKVYQDINVYPSWWGYSD